MILSKKIWDSYLYELEPGLYHCKLVGYDEDINYCCTKLTYDPVTNSDELVDIIFHQGKFYAVAEYGRALVVDSCSFKLVTIASPVSGGLVSSIKLVELLGDLLLVIEKLRFSS